MGIKRGVLIDFNPATYTASVLLMEATNSYLEQIPVATHIDGTSAQIGACCAILFFDDQNASDAVLLAVYPNGDKGIPQPTPGRIVLVPGQLRMNETINQGNVSTTTLTGDAGIPSGSQGVIYKCYYSSPNAGAFLQLSPHGSSNPGAYVTIGNIQMPNAYVNENGILGVDSQGRIDIKAIGGDCSVSLFTYGYIF